MAAAQVAWPGLMAQPMAAAYVYLCVLRVPECTRASVKSIFFFVTFRLPPNKGGRRARDKERLPGCHCLLACACFLQVCCVRSVLLWLLHRNVSLRFMYLCFS
jgi:hypothetical protein